MRCKWCIVRCKQPKPRPSLETLGFQYGLQQTEHRDYTKSYKRVESPTCALGPGTDWVFSKKQLQVFWDPCEYPTCGSLAVL